MRKFLVSGVVATFFLWTVVASAAPPGGPPGQDKQEQGQVLSEEENGSEDNGKKVTICHATSSETNPFEQITVSENAIGGHFDNPGTPKAGHEDDLLLDEGEDCPGVLGDDFPDCEELLAGGDGDLAHYETGMHQIPGGPLLEGADDVYSVGDDGNAVQCFCPPSGSDGIQSNWWKTDAEIPEGEDWIEIEDGSDWGLDEGRYLVMNLDFDCGEDGGEEDSARIHVVKVMDEDGDLATTDDQSDGGEGWEFDIGGTVETTGADSSTVEVEVAAGTYDVTETLMDGSVLVGVTCEGATTANGTFNATDGVTGIEVIAEDNVTCTFYNTGDVLGEDFPNCEDLLAGGDGDIAHFDSGMHQIPGGALLEGSDDVYSVGEDGNAVQCFCPPQGSGTQSNWWKTDQEAPEGWIVIENGAEWGLEEGRYLVMNSEFDCEDDGGEEGSARIHVNKVLDEDGDLATTEDQFPGGEGWEFDISGTMQSTGTDSSTASVEVAAGAHDVTETLMDGSVLVGVTCDGATTDNGTFNATDGVTGIDVVDGDDVTCTFYNSGDILGEEFPNCEELLAGGDGDLASYDTGLHQIPGGALLEGADDVYSMEGGNAVQCFCPPTGMGTQSNWWKTDEEAPEGWIVIENGIQWNLDDARYLVMNSEFECEDEGGEEEGDAHIHVVKMLDDDGDIGTTDDQTLGGEGWEFDIAGNMESTGLDSNTVLVDVDSAVGPHSVMETAKEGYTLVGVTCEGATTNNGTFGTDGVTGLELATADDVTCTFYNTADEGQGGNGETGSGTINVVKMLDEDGDLATTDDQTSGADGWQFDISGTVETTGTDGNTASVQVDLSTGPFSANETAMEGYDLAGVTCIGATDDNGTFGVDGISGLDLDDGDHVTCTFYNTPETLEEVSTSSSSGGGGGGGGFVRSFFNNNNSSDDDDEPAVLGESIEMASSEDSGDVGGAMTTLPRTGVAGLLMFLPAVLGLGALLRKK